MGLPFCRESFPARRALLARRAAGSSIAAFPKSSLLYNPFVDNGAVESGNGSRQQSMHGLPAKFFSRLIAGVGVCALGLV
jgi:hypothetical protein